LQLSWIHGCTLALEVRALQADRFKLTCLRDDVVSHYASGLLHELLSQTFGISDIRWMTPFEWENGLSKAKP
jgi:hypothetical protein